MRRRVLDGPGEAKAPDAERLELGVDLLAGEGHAQEAHGVADALVGIHERRGVPPLDDDVRRGPHAEGEPARRQLGQGGRLHGEKAGAPGVDGHHGRPEPQLGGGHGRQGERGEAVGAVGLAGPHIAVPELGQPFVPRRVRTQRDVVEGDGDPVAFHDRSVTPRRDPGTVEHETGFQPQLPLQGDGVGRHPRPAPHDDWRLDEPTRLAGRRGVAAARAALASTAPEARRADAA